jgi:hypothetical protein
MELALDFPADLPDTVRFKPVNFCDADPSVVFFDTSNTFQFAPMTAAKLLR